MNAQRIGVVEMSVAMASSGTIGWFVINSGASPAQVVFWRCLFGGSALAGVCAARRIAPWRLNRRQGLLCLGSGIAIVANWLLLFGAFPKAGLAVSTIVYNLQPFMLAFLGKLFLGEKLSVAKIGWLATGFAGLLLIVRVGLERGVGGADYLAGTIRALGAAACWAAAAFQTKLLSGTPPQSIALIHTVVGALMLAPAGLSNADHFSVSAWTMLAAIGIVHTCLVYILMYDAIHRLPTTIQGALSYLYPATAVLVDVSAFGHRVSWLEAAGMGAILVAASGMTGLQAALWGGLGRRRRHSVKQQIVDKSEQEHG